MTAHDVRFMIVTTDICRGQNGTGNYTLRPVIHVIKYIQPPRYNFDDTSAFDDNFLKTNTKEDMKRKKERIRNKNKQKEKKNVEGQKHKTMKRIHLTK